MKVCMNSPEGEVCLSPLTSTYGRLANIGVLYTEGLDTLESLGYMNLLLGCVNP